MSFDREMELVTLRLKYPERAAFVKVGSAYEFLDGYWGDKAELVLDSSRKWVQRTFVPNAPDGTKAHIQGGWDHEHCYLCQTKISDTGNADRGGYADQEDVWVCCDCFEQYVKPKRLDFVRM